MNDGIHFMHVDDGLDEVCVAYVSNNEFCSGRNRPMKPCREVIDDNDVLARINQFKNHVAADVARTTCHQNAHSLNLLSCSIGIPAARAWGLIPERNMQKTI